MHRPHLPHHSASSPGPSYHNRSKSPNRRTMVVWDDPDDPHHPSGIGATRRKRPGPRPERRSKRTVAFAPDECCSPPMPPIALSPGEIFAPPCADFDVPISSPQAIDRKLVQKIREKYKRPDASDSSHLGILYVLQVPGQEVFKIGRTSQKTETRIVAILKTCGITLQSVEQTPKMKYLFRSESLAHIELSNFVCQPDCHLHEHREYFSVPKDVALKTMKCWQKFAKQAPYDKKTGYLKDFWNDRLARMPPPAENEDVNDHAARQKRWQKFVSPTPLDIIRYQLRMLRPHLRILKENFEKFKKAVYNARGTIITVAVIIALVVVLAGSIPILLFILALAGILKLASFIKIRKKRKEKTPRQPRIEIYEADRYPYPHPNDVYRHVSARPRMYRGHNTYYY